MGEVPPELAAAPRGRAAPLRGQTEAAGRWAQAAARWGLAAPPEQPVLPEPPVEEELRAIRERPEWEAVAGAWERPERPGPGARAGQPEPAHQVPARAYAATRSLLRPMLLHRVWAQGRPVTQWRGAAEFFIAEASCRRGPSQSTARRSIAPPAAAITPFQPHAMAAGVCRRVPATTRWLSSQQPTCDERVTIDAVKSGEQERAHQRSYLITTPWQKGAGFPSTRRGRYRQVFAAASTMGSRRVEADERSTASPTRPSSATQISSFTM